MGWKTIGAINIDSHPVVNYIDESSYAKTQYCTPSIGEYTEGVTLCTYCTQKNFLYATVCHQLLKFDVFGFAVNVIEYHIHSKGSSVTCWKCISRLLKFYQGVVSSQKEQPVTTKQRR